MIWTYAQRAQEASKCDTIEQVSVASEEGSGYKEA